MAMPQEKLTQVSLSSRDPRFLTSKRKLEGSCVFEFKLVCRKIRKGSRVISAHLNIGRDGRDLTGTGLCTPAPEVMSYLLLGPAVARLYLGLDRHWPYHPSSQAADQ